MKKALNNGIAIGFLKTYQSNKKNTQSISIIELLIIQKLLSIYTKKLKSVT